MKTAKYSEMFLRSCCPHLRYSPRGLFWECVNTNTKDDSRICEALVMYLIMTPSRVPSLHVDISNGFVLRQSHRQSDVHINYNKRTKIRVFRECEVVHLSRLVQTFWWNLLSFILKAGLRPTFCNEDNNFFPEMLVIVPTKRSRIQDEKNGVLCRNKISNNLICTEGIEERSGKEVRSS
jgi:hypothetical protein